RYCDRASLIDLLREKRDNRAAGCHDFAVPCYAQGRSLALFNCPAPGYDILLHKGLAHSHRVYRVGCLVGAEEDRLFYARRDASRHDVVAADNVGLNGLHWEKLARRHLLQRRGVKDVIDPLEGVRNRVEVPHIADVEAYLRIFVALAHVVLFLLVTGQYPD